MTASRGSTGPRALAERLRTAKKRSVSSQKWLERQLNDPYVARAKAEGYRSRAAYKLLEMDERYKFLRAGQRVVDLGAAPGGWSQVAARKTGSAEGRGGVVGIDLLPIETLPGATFLEQDFMDAEAPHRLMALLDGPADVVMSDMAANATGHRKTDHLRIMGLAETAAAFARQVLAPKGIFIAKVLQGGTEGELLADLKRDFALVRHVKPAASRADSAELYVLATGFRGSTGSDP